MKDKYFFHHRNSRFFKISGEDSKTFIQNLITNDITKCKNNEFIYSCLLSPQGKFLADFFIFKINEYYFFETDKKFYLNLLNKFKMYKLRSNINIEEENLFSYSLFNEEYDVDFLIQNSDPRNKNLGSKIILQNQIELQNKDTIQINEIEYHEILIKNYTPYSHLDLIENKSYLQEEM